MINGFINEERNDYSAQHPTFAIIFILLMVLIFVLYGSSMIFALILARTSKQLSDSEKLRWTILIILLGPIGISLFLWTQGRNAGTRKHV
jgi:hypothetical protein